jgi:centriolar protein POC1
VKLYDIRSHRLIQHYDAHADSVTSCYFHPTGNYLLTGSNDSTLKLWDLRQGCAMYTLYGHERSTKSVAFSKTGDYFASGGADKNVMVWKSNFDVEGETAINEIE